MTVQWYRKMRGPGIAHELIVRSKAGRGFGIRLGRSEWHNFSERYQGTHGIPKRYWYFFGERLTFVRYPL